MSMTNEAEPEQAAATPGNGADPGDEPGPEYAIVEVFGHRRLTGEIREVERFGAKLLRVDVPVDGDFARGVTTQFYGGGAIFSVTPCDLATVERLNRPYRQAGVYSLPPPSDSDDGQDGASAEEDWS